MIEANDLRVGNCVEYKGEQKIIHQISSGYENGVVSFEDHISKVSDFKNEYTIFPLTDVQPILLTEEILLKCGFKPITNRKTFLIKLKEAFEFRYIPLGQRDECYLVIVKDEGKYCHIVPADSSKGCSFIPLESFHRLQNLYFALTGKEL